MGYLICAHCGNYDKFSKLVRGYETYTEINYYDGEEEFLDCDDREYGDGDIDSQEDYTCYECNSEEIEEFELKTERVKFIYLHKDKQDMWNYEELPEDQRDETYLVEELAKLV